MAKSKYKKRADGRYMIQIQVGVDPKTGRVKKKSIYAKTIRELEDTAAKYRLNLEKGLIIDDKGLTVEKWGMAWLEIYKSNKAYGTKTLYEIMLKAHIIPAIGMLKLKDVRDYHVRGIINKKVAEGHIRTAQNILLCVKQIFKTAVANKYIYENVTDGIEKPVGVASKKRILTQQEIGLIDTADLTLKERAFLLTALHTGVRRGEELALSEKDIDLTGKILTVNKAIFFKHNQAEIKYMPKSVSGIRSIPIIDELHEVLSEYIGKLNGIVQFPSKNTLVGESPETKYNQYEYKPLFSSASGGLMSEAVFRRFWGNIIDKLNIAAGGRTDYLKDENGEYMRDEYGKRKTSRVMAIASDITPHIFRHTFATNLYYAGVDIKMAQYLLGHASIEMTMEIYTHLDKETNKDAIGKLNEYIKQSKISQKEKGLPG